MRKFERHREIVACLDGRGSASVAELAQRFGVSEVTIRKDLAELEREGLLQRTYGGAVLRRPKRYNPGFREKLALRPTAKANIAKAALAHIREGDTIILDAGTTTLALAKEIRQRFDSLVILTNSIAIALEVVETSNRLILIGGEVRSHSLAVIGPDSVSALGRYHVEKAFLGATGFSLRRGYTTPNPVEAETKRAMIEAAEKVYVLTDASKMENIGLSVFARPDEVDVLITTADAPAEVLGALRAMGCAVEVVPAEEPMADRWGDEPVVTTRAGGHGNEHGDR